MTNIALQVHQERAEGLLGASSAACALGLDDYKSPLTLWKQLRGEDVDDTRPAYVNEAAEWGQAIEPLLRGKYALARQCAVWVPSSSYVLDGWLRCTPDGIVASGHSNGETIDWHGDEIPPESIGLWQGKTCSMYKRDEWIDWIPRAYEIQVRVEMAVTKLPWCDVECLVGGQRKVGPFRVERDAQLEDRILTDLRAFWKMVKDGTEPSVDDSTAWRQHVSERMRPTKVAIIPDDELKSKIGQWQAARAAKKSAESREALAKTDLLLALSAAGATKIALGKESISAYQTGARTDWKAYAKSLGGAEKPPEQFKGAAGSWTLRAPGSWGSDDE